MGLAAARPQPGLSQASLCVCTSADNSALSTSLTSHHLPTSLPLSLSVSGGRREDLLKAFFIQRDTKYWQVVLQAIWKIKNMTLPGYSLTMYDTVTVSHVTMWHHHETPTIWWYFFLLKFPQHICLSQLLTGLKPITIMTDMGKNFLSHANFLNFSCQHLLNDRQWNRKTWKEKFVTFWRVTFKSDHIH